MGEVWRASDTTLGRQVAIKVLPDAVAQDAERIARFEREARTLAVLSHPNIAIVHGFEKANGVSALVMELVEGPTLADRIAEGPVPLDEALPIARQVAEALEAAHEHGIVHRDLKPANIKLKSDGTVKVLDFGLAKAVEGSSVRADLSASPTITSPAMTIGGVILGTAAYMSPEQAKGKPVDKRTDIWAFGCVLYEMLTGTRAFEGEDATETIAAIVRAEPSWERLPNVTPSSIRRLLSRCLRKSAKHRLADIADARFELEDVAASETPQRVTASSHVHARPWILALVFASACAATGLAVWMLVRPRAVETVPHRLTLQMPTNFAWRTGTIAVSPDGTHIVFGGLEAGRRSLYLRRIDQLDAQPIRGTDDAIAPFFSPDGEWVGFFTGSGPGSGLLRKVSVNGGAPVTICEARFPGGGTWLPDDTIVFSSAASTGLPSIMRVSASAGTPAVVLTPDGTQRQRQFRWPSVLPDGDTVLFTIRGFGSFDEASVGMLSLASGTVTPLIERGYHARFVPSGHIVYVLGRNLMAVRFDARRKTLSGPPVTIIQDLATSTNIGDASFGFSALGFLVYATGGNNVGTRSLVWVDRSGKEQALEAPTDAYAYPRISPDGTRIAIDVRDEDSDIVVLDLVRNSLTRPSPHPARDVYPVWTPDSKRIVFGSARDGADNLYVQNADGSGNVERLTTSTNSHIPYSFSADAKYLAIRAGGPDSSIDVHLFKIGERDPRPLLASRFREANGEISPSSKWIAYQSDDSGTFEIYVRPFPDVNSGRWPVSVGGGTRPVWSRNGGELFYVSLTGDVMSVAVTEDPNFKAEAPKRLFRGDYMLEFEGRSFDANSDGSRFLMIKRRTDDDLSMSSSLTVVEHWFDELNRLAPVKK
jgi:serine/threonine-protein kinase